MGTALSRVVQGDIPSIHTNHPLNKTTAEIRLLQFLRPRKGTISLRFQTYELDKCPPYTALSYAWGEEHPTIDIFVDGTSSTVRENLGLALHRIQEKVTAGKFDKPFLLWVDALCINQEDLVERSHQVNMMGQIYSRAKLVVVWLGKEDEDSHIAMGFIGGILTWTDSSPGGNQRLFNALNAFFRRPYWNRLWIQQEIVLARKFVVLCGAFSRTGEDVLRLTLLDYRYNGTPAISTLRRIKAWYREERNRTLDNLLLKWNDIDQTNCSDPRDRVFGLLGIVEQSERGRLGLEADYGKNAEEIWCDARDYMARLPEEERYGLTETLLTMMYSLKLERSDLGQKFLISNPSTALQRRGAILGPGKQPER